MKLDFYKYQGTGNDFVMIDDRLEKFPITDLALVRQICERKFGIGSDGLILIRNKPAFDFEMIYYNADGTQSMCGNGARCAVAFSKFLGLINEKANFIAIDGNHTAKIVDDYVELGMNPVSQISVSGQDYFVNTGSPHHIRFVSDVHNYPVVEEGAKIRYSDNYLPNGTNVNFVTQISDNEIFVRTYERGVENETLSCGTGVTACALVFGYRNELNDVIIHTLGGKLRVKFTKDPDNSFKNITLSGPSKQVFAGKISPATYEADSSKI